MAEVAQDAASPWARYTVRRRWLFLFVLFLVSTSSYVDRVVISVLLEPIKAEFGVSDAALGLLSGVSFALFYATAGIPIARIADRGNRKTLIALSLAAWSLMTALCGMAGKFWLLMMARIGVGAGEAGCIPAAQSLIADYFPPKQRGRAIAILTVSGTVGYILALSLGGQIVAAHGWRFTFVAFGLPGLLLAVLVYFVLQEPRTMLLDRAPAREEFLGTIRALLAKRSFLLLTAGSTAYFFVAYGALIFVPSYLVRVVHVPIQTAGLVYGVASAVGVAIGSLGGGYLSDTLSRRDPRWLARVPGLALLLGTVPAAGMFLVDDLRWFAVVSTVNAICFNVAVPTMFVAFHAICGNVRRATTLAIVSFLGNLVGFGLGPVITGALSDYFTFMYGPAGLRYALFAVMLLAAPAGLLILRAGAFVHRDSEP